MRGGALRARGEAVLFVCVCVSCPCSVVISKLDVLDTFEEIKIGEAYILDGERVESMPGETAR